MGLKKGISSEFTVVENKGSSPEILPHTFVSQTSYQSKENQPKNIAESIFAILGIARPDPKSRGLSFNRVVFILILVAFIGAIVLSAWVFIQDNNLGRLETINGLNWLGAKVIAIALFLTGVVSLIMLAWAFVLILFGKKKKNGT